MLELHYVSQVKRKHSIGFDTPCHIMMNLNLYLAAFWGIVGLVLLLWPLFDPQAPRLQILHTGVSFGWVAIFFWLYNLARWWGIRATVRQRRAAADLAARKSRATEQADRTPRTPDPRFNFSEPSDDPSTPDTPSR
jgi:hypothetical protein